MADQSQTVSDEAEPSTSTNRLERLEPTHVKRGLYLIVVSLYPARTVTDLSSTATTSTCVPPSPIAAVGITDGISFANSLIGPVMLGLSASIARAASVSASGEVG